MTGNQVSHLLLISLVNITMDFQIKVSNHTLMVLAQLLVPKFLHGNKKICGDLENHLIHECIDSIVKPLKKAAKIGVMMSDPLG